MRIIGKNILDDYKRRYVDVCSQIDAWCAETTAAAWKMPMDIKRRYCTASLLENDHIVFNLKGNKFRLLVQVNYKNQIVLIKKVGTHNDYMNW